MQKHWWVQSAILAVVVWALLNFLGHFTALQSTVLTLIVVAVAPPRPFATSTPRGFIPYFVRFEPHIGNMLLDLGLIENSEQYQRIVGQAQPFHPWLPEHIYHYAVNAVCISFDPITGFTMTHFPHSGVYTTRMSWACPLPGVPFRSGVGDRFCQFTIRSRSDGIHFGLDVDMDWWKKNKGLAKAKVLREDLEWGTGSAYLSLALLPFAEFEEYYNPITSTKRSEIDKSLKDNGWEEDKYQIPELGKTYITYKHRYMDVCSHEIE